MKKEEAEKRSENGSNPKRGVERGRTFTRKWRMRAPEKNEKT